MKHNRTLLFLSITFFITALGIYLIQNEFSLLMFGLLIAGMSCGRYSNRLGRLRTMRVEGNDPGERVATARGWYHSTERKTDRFGTRYVTPSIFVVGFLLALLRDRLDIGLFSGLILVMYITDRIIIRKLDTFSQTVLAGSDAGMDENPAQGETS